jgi:hypothetical protein
MESNVADLWGETIAAPFDVRRTDDSEELPLLLGRNAESCGLSQKAAGGGD